jgi:Fur family ferric uptake transcriptional regulator
MNNNYKHFAGITKPYSELLIEFKNLLKKNGLKYTTQREVILEILYNCEEHLTPESLHSLIQKKMPELNIGIATVYRTLLLLENSELVTSISFGSAGKKYELGAKEHHDHLICVNCNSIIEFLDEEIEKKQLEIAKNLNFKTTSHSMQIYGLCQKCQ